MFNFNAWVLKHIAPALPGADIEIRPELRQAIFTYRSPLEARPHRRLQPIHVWMDEATFRLLAGCCGERQDMAGFRANRTVSSRLNPHGHLILLGEAYDGPLVIDISGVIS